MIGTQLKHLTGSRDATLLFSSKMQEKQEIKVKASEPVKKIPAVKPEVPPAKSTTKPKPEPLPSVEIQVS